MTTAKLGGTYWKQSMKKAFERGKSDERKRILEIIDGMSEELHIADIKELKRRVVERLE